LIGGNADGAIYALNARTGRKVWGFQLSQRGINSSVVVDGHRVYATHSEENHDTTAMGRVVCIDARGTGDVTASRELWRADGVAAGYASPALSGGRLYVMDNFGVLYCLDAQDGREIWKQTVGRVGKGSPTVADGKVYVATVNGLFTILEDEGDQARVLDTIEIEGDDETVVELFGSPAVSDGRVLFFTTEEMICLGRKDARPQAVEVAPPPRESPSGSAAAALMQVRPAEVLVEPGEAVAFRAVAFDLGGRSLGSVKPHWSYEGNGGSIGEGDGLLKITGQGGGTGVVRAEFLDLSDAPAPGQTISYSPLTATARVRVVPELPIAEDFESYDEGEMLNWWIGVSKAKHAIETLDGSKVLKKLSDDRGPKFNRSRVYITPPLATGYTVEADVRGVAQKRRRGDVGLINARYRLELFGNLPRLRVISWVPGPRFEERIDFSWEPDRWYRVKFRVDLEDGKAYPRVKVWPRDEAEPDAWLLEGEDPQPNLEGSAGIYAYSQAPVYFDNVRIYREDEE